MAHQKARIIGIVGITILFEGGLLILAFGLGWLLNSPPFLRLRFDRLMVFWGLIGTAPPLLLLLWCTHSTWKPLARIVREVEKNIFPLLDGCSLSDFAVISLCAGVAEEILFRGDSDR